MNTVIRKKFNCYFAYIRIICAYFGYAYLVSLFTIFILIILAIFPQHIQIILLVTILIMLICFRFLFLKQEQNNFIVSKICWNFFNLLETKLNKVTRLCDNGLCDIFIKKVSFRRESLHDREFEYQEVYVDDEYVLKERNKRILAWMVDTKDTESEDFVYKIFIFYSLRINKFLVLLAFPEIVFIPVTLAFIQHSSLYALFFLTFIVTIFKKLSILRDDAVYIQGNLRYKYKSYILSVENISENVREMLSDISTESFRNILGALKIILSN